VPDSTGWIDKFSQKVLSWFSQREVKTPLAFFFRLVGATVVIVIAALYLVPYEARFEVFEFGVGVLIFLAIMVALFAWMGVKNLVYGESGHRAEMRIKFGTEKREFSQAEMQALRQSTNPDHPLPAGGHPQGDLQAEGGQT
jgi:hypothetical protein